MPGRRPEGDAGCATGRPEPAAAACDRAASVPQGCAGCAPRGWRLPGAPPRGVAWPDIRPTAVIGEVLQDAAEAAAPPLPGQQASPPRLSGDASPGAISDWQVFSNSTSWGGRSFRPSSRFGGGGRRGSETIEVVRRVWCFCAALSSQQTWPQKGKILKEVFLISL